MKTAKRILSTALALLMVLSVCSTGFSVSASDTASGSILKEIDMTPVARPSVDFYCTEVTRVAAGVNSAETGTTIVKATPSGVPELSGTYVSQAYAGETPAATKIVFVSPTAGISITGFSCSNSTVTFSDTAFTAPGTYTTEITGGTAAAGEALIFTIDYTWTDGNTYQEKCVSYVENIVTGGSYAEHRVTWKPYNGTSSWYRGYASAITRVLGKGVYYETPADAGMSQQYGSYNVATTNFASGNGLTSYYVNEREEKAGLFSNPRETIDHTLFVTGTSQAHIYIDSSVASSLSDINLRIDANVGREDGETHVRNNDTPNVALGESYVVAGAQTSAPSGYSTDGTAQAAIGYNVPARSAYGFDSQNGAYSTITSGSRNGGHIITSHLTGSVAGLVDGASYTVINRYYAYFRGSYAYITNSPIVPVIMNFHIIDKGALREMIDYVMNSDPASPAVRNPKKGINPQSWYYSSGFSAFQTQYTDALNLLNNPQATQTAIDAKVKALQSAYNSLVLDKAIYDEVDRLYDLAQEIVDNAECYPASDVALVREAQEMVKTGYNILYQPAVDTMAYNLQLAIERAMPYGANYEAIYALKLEYEALDLSVYTPESQKVVTDAFAKVDYTLTALQQSQVDAWAAEIRAAIDNLSPYMADFSKLKATLDEAKAIDRTLYINGSLLLDPMEAAEEAIADNEANPWELSRQPEVDTLEQTLREKIDGLILRSVYKLDLKEALEAEIPGNADYYDQAILAEYNTLLEEGWEMYNDSTLTIYDQKNIDAKTEEIVAKYEELMASYSIPSVDFTNLNAALSSAEEIDPADYCDDEQMAELNAAVEAGLAILEEKPELNDENTARTEAAADRINAAIEALNAHEAAEAVQENVEEADCVNGGSYDSVVYCSLCGEELSRETVNVSALGHTEGEAVIENEKAADCVNDGSYDTVVYCTVCGEEVSRETTVVDALGHTEGEAVVENEKAADCVNAGSYDTVVYCTVCGEEVSRETTVVDALGHTEGEWEVTKEAEVGVAGEETLYCTVCGEVIDTREIPAILAYFVAEEGTTTVIDKEHGIIYGLSDEGLDDIEDYVEYEGGVVEYEYLGEYFGTGTVVNFVVDGEVYESYTVVIFGDLNGDGVVDSYDYSVLAAMVNGDIEAEEGTALYLAADLFVDGAVDAYDLSVISAYVNGDAEITQTPEIEF